LDAVRSTLALIGEPALCERYVRALGAFGIAAPVVEGVASAGFWRIALEAGFRGRRRRRLRAGFRAL